MLTVPTFSTTIQLALFANLTAFSKSYQLSNAYVIVAIKVSPAQVTSKTLRSSDGFI